MSTFSTYLVDAGLSCRLGAQTRVQFWCVFAQASHCTPLGGGAKFPLVNLQGVSINGAPVYHEYIALKSVLSVHTPRLENPEPSDHPYNLKNYQLRGDRRIRKRLLITSDLASLENHVCSPT